MPDAVELRLMGPGLLVSWDPLGSQRRMGSRAATHGYLHSLPLRGKHASTVCTGVLPATFLTLLPREPQTAELHACHVTVSGFAVTGVSRQPCPEASMSYHVSSLKNACIAMID